MEIQSSSIAGGTEYAACMMSLGHQVAELRKDIGDVECGIKESILSQSLSNGQEFCAVNKNISDHAHRNVIEILTNRSALKDVECNFSNKMSDEISIVKAQINSFQRDTDHQFCEVKSLIKDSTAIIMKQLADDKLDEKNDEIAKLRSKNERLEDRFIISQELNGLKTMINSVEQNQRFNSKTVQFGTGNVALPTQTANQG